MIRRLVAHCALACAVLALAACESGREAPPKVVVRVTNAAPGFETLVFQREADTRNAVELPFKNSTEFVYDADSYDFFTFDPGTPGSSWTAAVDLLPETGNIIVLTELGANVVPVALSYTAASSTEAQIVALHAGSDLPALDLYLEAPGVGIAGATPRGTFNPGGQIAPRTLPAGNYELTLTVAGDPSSILLESNTIALSAGETTAFIVVPEGGQGTQPLSVILLQGTGSVLNDRDAPAELRVINAATDQMPRDVAIDNQFSPPLFSNVPFAAPTPYAQTNVRSQPIAVTPVGNPGVLELDQSYNGVATQRATMLFTGPAGALTHTFAVDDGRRLHSEAKVRFMNAAAQFTAVDFVLTSPGDDPNQYAALAALAAPGISAYGQVAPGEYDLYVRENNAATLYAGPMRVSVAAGGIYGVLAVNGPDATTVTMVLLDDFVQ